MNYRDVIAIAIGKQGIDLELKDVPFNVFMKSTGDVLTLCFLEDETDDFLVIVETNVLGREELRIIPKVNIEYIGIFYDFDGFDEKEEDIMFI